MIQPPVRLDPAGPLGEPFDYACGDTLLRGTLYRPPAVTGAVPGVLVGHTAIGLTEHVRARAQALATEGYVALAYDLYGAEGFPEGEARALHDALCRTPGLFQARGLAALEALAGDPSVDGDRIAIVGFCQGGIVAAELARAAAPIRAAIPPAACRAFADEMTVKGAPWEIVLPGGNTHSFSDPSVDRHGLPEFRYDARADRRSWAATLDLLAEVFA